MFKLAMLLGGVTQSKKVMKYLAASYSVYS